MTGDTAEVATQNDLAPAALPAADTPAEAKKRKPKTAPNPKRQKEARQRLDSLFSDRSNVWVIHYSCESFYDRPNGASPRITSLAVRSLDSAQTHSFSIHQVAERLKVPFAEIEARYDELERQMLDAYYQHLGAHRGMKYLHWNMRDINYGFAAIDHRYQVLGGTPVLVDDARKFDLSRILIDIYGVAYIGHSRLEKLIEKNEIQPRDMMTGAEEAQAFIDGNYVGLHQSTLRKVDVLANIAERAQNKHLLTNTTWWEMHGGNLRTALDWVADNKVIALVIAVIGLVLAIYAIA
ncbi:hypothetical protein SAMN06297144_2291 [Sphingomonas guangdongensis]|uniref:Uncharacterized protein n=1 Tax=Sphingomonas guangdongensis TaxID=1141890 RepID=A0A285R065_9SPHN|nr:hypothetical protein [Sphingomonas guangdongensis]SOB87168.1 hypothetical protein SAMN06297144_2291 [Sphingomonas guangdongensis]